MLLFLQDNFKHYKNPHRTDLHFLIYSLYDVVMKTIKQHFITQKLTTKLYQDLSNILDDFALASKQIRSQIIRAGLVDGVLESSGQMNTSGEATQALDVLSNDIIKNALNQNGTVAYMGSEEDADVIESEDCETSDYVALFDPLDGSSNIDVNVSVGTIFSIFKKSSSATNSLEQCCQKGREQVAAGYVIYGSSVVFVFTVGHGVHSFTYDPLVGEFLLSHANIRMPSEPAYYSINESLYESCDQLNQNYINDLKRQFSLRYVGSLVADFHRNLLKGGIYIYPATTTNPNGKLRLLYEANPLAFICEQAGGTATNGIDNILDLDPKALHERVPLYIGSSELIESYQASKLQFNLA